MRQGVVLFALHVFLPLTQASKGPLRSEFLKEGNFRNPIKEKSLTGHVITSVTVDGYVDCALECTWHDSCQSFNYQTGSVTQHQCELSSRSRDSHPSALQPRTGFDYYDTAKTVPSACAGSPCVHGGTCVRSCDVQGGYDCQCIKHESYGDKCQYWTSDISSSNFDFHFTKQSTTDYAVIDVTSGFTAFTACVWLSTTCSSSSPLTIFSYAVTAQVSELVFSCISQLTECTVTIDDEKRTAYSVPLNDGRWHYICVKWENTNGLWSYYVDGEKRGHGTNFKASYTIRGQGKIVVGQEQGVLEGGFTASKSYIGKMSRFNLWSGSDVTEAIIKTHAQTCPHVYGNLVDWREIKYDNYHGDIKPVTPSSCASLVNQSDYVFNFPVTSDDKYIQLQSLSDPLSKLTLCFWQQISKGDVAFISYKTATYTSAFHVYTGTKAAYHFDINGGYKKYHAPLLQDGIWHHVCFTWDNTNGYHRQYYDGVLKVTWKNWKTGQTVASGGTLVFGKKLLNDGSFSQTLEYIGKLTRLNLWSSVLSGEIIDSMSFGPGTEYGDVIGWRDLRGGARGGVLVEESASIVLNAQENDYSMTFPTRSTANYVFYNSLPTLSELTACLWIKTTDGGEITFFSYSISSSDTNTFFLRSLDNSVSISFSIRGTWQNYAGPNTRDNSWVPICVTWTSSNGRYDLYMYGDRQYYRTGFRTGLVIPGGGKFIVGQEQDSYGGDFSSSQSFVGIMSHLEIWDFAYSFDFIWQFSNGCGTWSGNAVSWRDLRSAPKYGGITLQSLSDCTLPGFITQKKRDKWCQDKYSSSPSTGCSLPMYALFAPKSSQKGFRWRCYYSTSVESVYRNQGFEYDKNKNSGCLYTLIALATMHN